LSGLQCFQDAQELLSCAKDDEFYGPKIFSNLDVIDTNILWNEAYRNIDRLLYAADCLKHGQHHISPEDKYDLSLAIALMLRCAIDSGQVNAGLEVARTIIPTFNRPGLPGTTVKEKMKSFFGFGEGDVEPDDDFWSLSDELYAAKLSAYRVKYGVDSALDIYFSSNDSTNSPKYSDKGWFKTVNLVLQMLIEKGDIEKAFSFFERMHPSDRGPDTYVVIAKAYKDLERFDKIGKVYMDAKKAALLSEKLCLCAMEAIVRGNHHGKIKILRSIVSDISEIKGVKPGKWIADHYWTIKRCLGFHYARLLMWWNDPNETKSMEYRLAIQHMDHRKKQNLQVETDALRCIIKLAEDQSLDVVQSSDVLRPPSRVFDSLIVLSTSQCHDKTQLLLEGLTYLLKTQSTLLGIEYLDYIKTNHISVDEKVSDLARSVANSQGDTTIIN
jgi:pentatricopeptide repeat protein